METQIESRHSQQIAQKAVLKPGNRWFLIAITTLSVALIGAILILSFPATNQQTDSQRALEAISARYQGLTDLYDSGEEADTQRVLEAISARYQGLTDLYMSDKK